MRPINSENLDLETTGVTPMTKTNTNALLMLWLGYDVLIAATVQNHLSSPFPLNPMLWVANSEPISSGWLTENSVVCLLPWEQPQSLPIHIFDPVFSIN